MTAVLRVAAAAGFEAARRVSLLPAGHSSRRLHGHSFLARVVAAPPAAWAAFPGGEVGELQQRLARCLAPLDYQLLNDQFEQPTDECLARWLLANVDVPGIDEVGIQSTAHEGADLDARGGAHVWRRYAFQAAHQLPQVPPGHKCGRMHGHGFEVILHAQVHLGARALAIDFDHLDRCWAPLQQALDYTCLNDIPGLANPTSELIASWIWERLKPGLPELSWVTVYETASCGANYDGRHYRIWKELTLDSAVRLRRAPAGDPRGRIHGHSYLLRLHLSAPLDQVRGWTLDFGDVKELFTPVFDALDHQALYALPGMVDNDPGSVAVWVKEQAAPRLPGLDRIDVYETRGCGAILGWGEPGPPLPV